jgi:hypothetical protein
MGDIILLTYGHDYKHKKFIKFWREFRKRNPTAKNTPELARCEIYNLRFDDDPQDTYLVKKELNYFTDPRQHTFFLFDRNGIIAKIICKIFSKLFKRKFNIYEPIEAKAKIDGTFGHFGVMPIFEKKDAYKWNNNEP